MPNLPGRLASIVVFACLVAGCQPPAPAPTPVPSYRCTPEAGGADSDCSQHQYDEMVAKDKLYAEAEAVYRKFLAEDMRIARSGGISQPTGVLHETTTGAFLEDVMSGYREDKAGEVTVRGGDRIIKVISRLPSIAKAGSEVALRACVDSSSIEVYRRGKQVGTGLVTSDDLYFGRSSGKLKILGADGEEVKSCDS